MRARGSPLPPVVRAVGETLSDAACAAARLKLGARPAGAVAAGTVCTASVRRSTACAAGLHLLGADGGDDLRSTQPAIPSRGAHAAG